MGRLACLLLLAGCSIAPTASDRPVNFVVIISDDQGGEDLSCYGHPVLRTPNIDRLAREGMRFDRAFLTISSCSPSRASILTGRYPHNTGAPDLHQPLPADQRTVSRYLREAGYHTMAVGKWHLGKPERAQWDKVVDCPAPDLEQQALALLADRPKGKPFFFWVASPDPHRPFGETPGIAPHDPAKVVVPPYLPDHPLLRKDLALYYDRIARLDRQVGALLEALSAQGLLDSTFVVFMSDNGMPFPRAKTTLYDAGIRTPFLVRYPPLIRAGTVTKRLISSIDLAPTILELAGVEQSSMQGRSFRRLVQDPSGPGRDAVFAEANWHDFAQFTRAVRTERYLLVRNFYADKPLWNSVDSIQSDTWTAMLEAKAAGRLTPAQADLFVEPRPEEELYDLESDPHALKNVWGDREHSWTIAPLRHRLAEWMGESGDRLPAERKPDGWTRDGIPLPHNQPWYDEWKRKGKSSLEAPK
jgi:N-sulfoglucosamine sulfohydrolase